MTEQTTITLPQAPAKTKPIKSATVRRKLDHLSSRNSELSKTVSEYLSQLEGTLAHHETGQAHACYWLTRSLAVAVAKAIDPNYKPGDHH